jgi:deferrochelatase/peroxidase EfeB
LAQFKQIFASFALPKIITSSQLVENPPPSPKDNPKHPFIGFNVAFTSSGLRLFGLDPAAIGDASFTRGQLVDSQNLGDPGVGRDRSWSPHWSAEYKTAIHGIFLITAYNNPNAQNFIRQLEGAFTSSIKLVVNLHGYPRLNPKEEQNDAFGFRGGGVTNPQVKDVTFSDIRPMRFTGTAVVPIGVIVLGREGDEDKDRRPAWAVDGSLIATRKLNCLVPEFDEFCLREGGKTFQSLVPAQAAEKYAARLMGRWKNGEHSLSGMTTSDLSNVHPRNGSRNVSRQRRTGHREGRQSDQQLRV